MPWHDVIQVSKIKTKSYYLLHGMTMVVKDMVDEVCRVNENAVVYNLLIDGCLDLL